MKCITFISDKAWAEIRNYFKENVRGRKPKHTPKLIWEAICYVCKSGCQWRLLPDSYPPWKTVYHYFRKWSLSGLIERINRKLRDRVRKKHGKNYKPRVVIVDSQSAKTSFAGGIRGFDGNKKVNGRKRHIMVDSLGLLISALVLRANKHDLRGGQLLLNRITYDPCLDRVREVHCDGAYKGLKKPKKAKLSVIISKAIKGLGFKPIVHRWKVERTLAWFHGSRRLNRDYERKCIYAEAWLYVASICLLARRLAA